MNRNTITKILVIMILIVLLSFVTRASILAMIGTQALSFADPDAAKAVQTVLTAYQLISSPTSAITSQVVGQITGQIMGEIEGASPEAAKAIKTYQQVQGWVDQGAKITKELQLDKDSQLANGAIQMGDKEEDVSKLVNSDLKEGSIKVSNMEVSSKEEGGDVTFTAKEGGRVEINGKKYENLKEGSKIITDRDGSIKEADMTFDKPTSVEIGGKKLQVDKGMRVVYKDGNTEVFGKDQMVQVDQQKVKINGENSIKLEGQKITGKDFTLDEKRFTGIEDKSAEVTLVEEGYLMGKNTQMEDGRMVIDSEKGDVLYSKMCENVAGFDNYVSPCKSTLTMEGDGFSVQMKEGKHFGLDIEKNDVLKYEMYGSKVVINNGEQTVYTSLGKSVMVTNGEIVTTYLTKDGEPQELINPNTLYGDYDVAMSTELKSFESFDEETIITTQNEQIEGGQVENAKENVYVCPAGLETSGAAVTGAFFTKKCPQSTTVTTTNPEIKPGSAKKGDNWGGEKIIGVYDRTATSLVVHTEDASGNINIYRINTDGKVERKVLGDWVVDKEYVLSDPEKKWFGLTAGSKAQDVISNQKVNKIDDIAKGVTEKIGGGSIIEGVSYKTMGNRLVEQGTNEFVGYISTRKSGIIETSDGRRFKELPNGVIKELQ